MENDEAKCRTRRWKEEETNLMKRMGLLQQIENEAEKETPETISNEASEYTCEHCGCDHCGQPMLLRECSRCGSTLCGCHILPEEHDCVAVPFKQGWIEYAKWQEKF